MQIQPISEGAYLTACMTFDAIRQEVLLHRQISGQQQQEIAELQAKIKGLEKELAAKEEIISSHLEEEFKENVEGS